MNETLPKFLARIERDYADGDMWLLIDSRDIRRLFETAKKYDAMVHALAEEKLSEHANGGA